MESRKRFRAEVSQEVIKKMFVKRRPAKEEKSTVESGTSENTVTSIPVEMLPKFKSIPSKKREYITKTEAPALSRAEVFNIERQNIKEKLDMQIKWSRAHKSLNSAFKPKQELIHAPVSPDDEEDTFGGSCNPSDIPRKRENRSKEFLQSFFKEAKSLKNEFESKKRKKSPKIPKLLSGVEPGTEEIVL